VEFYINREKHYMVYVVGLPLGKLDQQHKSNLFVQIVYDVLTLCNLPKAEEAITEVTSNHLEFWIYPSKTLRGLSLFDITLFVWNCRLVKKYMVWVF
jgi:hypothetical protein